MKPAYHDIRVPRGGTPFLGVRLHGRDPRSGQVARLPQPGVTVEWTVEWPSGEAVRSQFTAPAPLAVDQRTGAILYPLTQEQADDIASAPTPIPYRIRIIMSDGFAFPFLVGTIATEDSP